MRCLEKDLLNLKDEVFGLTSFGRISYETCTFNERKWLAKDYIVAHQFSFNDVRTFILGEDEVVDAFDKKYSVSLRDDEYYQYSDDQIDEFFINFVFDNTLPVHKILKDSFIEDLECYFGELFEKSIFIKADQDKSCNDYNLFREFGCDLLGDM